MYLGITKAIQDKFKIKVEVVEEKIPEILCWHAHKFVFNRKTGLIFMNDFTRYIVVVYEIRKKEIENLSEVFKEQLKRNMILDKIDKNKVEKYLKDLGEIRFIKTSSRSILGQIKDAIFCLDYELEDMHNIKGNKIDYINSKLNDMPMLRIKSFPNKFMLEEISKIY
ncbi:MAG: hypothetical protein JG768_1439 [Fusobacteriales bacterium]|jgi:hypothetical protein|nr:hypothetical protein [Fusobacteriales bacterium]